MAVYIYSVHIMSVHMDIYVIIEQSLFLICYCLLIMIKLLFSLYLN